MVTKLKKSIVRIFNSKGNISGAGFLVNKSYVVTCAHVVSSALNLSEYYQEKPNDKIDLDFPLVTTGKKLKAKVVHWLPVNPNQVIPPERGEDIAILEIVGDLPEHCHPPRMVKSDDLWGHIFRAFGFPKGKNMGVWANGILLDTSANGWIGVEGIDNSGYFVEPGFSGTPVWDEEVDGIVGIVVASEKQTAIKAAFIIPSTILTKAWPALEKQTMPPCPYRGLFAFREKDFQYFFGRENFSQKLFEDVSKKQLVVIIGSSGSGKSSVVFAGLIPKLRKEGNWKIASFRPGNNPFQALAGALVPLLEPKMTQTDQLTEIKKLAEKFKNKELSLLEVAEKILQDSTETNFLLIADQFEELYTLCQEAETRHSFLDELLKTFNVKSHSSTFKLVLTLRADFLGHALGYRPFTDALQNADSKLGPMNLKELKEAIVKPIEKTGIEIEEGLIDLILGVVSREPGNLPLLEFSMTQLWEKQEDGRLTHAAYKEIGGIEKALAEHAEKVYGDLSNEEKEQAHKIFIQLVSPGEGTEDTRRIAIRSELGENNWNLITNLANTRVIITGRDETSGEETAEIVHEALIREWKRLRDWMEIDRVFRTWQDLLKFNIRKWEEKQKVDDALLQGINLAEAENWLKKREDYLSKAEQEYIRLSIKYQAKEQARRKCKQILVILGLVASLFIVTVSAILAGLQWRRAEKQKRIAVAQKLASQAELLRGQKPSFMVRSMLLAIESIRLSNSVEADQTLRKGLGLLPPPFIFQTKHTKVINSITFSPDGKCLAIGSNDKSAMVWEIPSGNEISVIKNEKTITSISISPNGKYIAIAIGRRGKIIQILDIGTGKEISRAEFDFLRYSINKIVFSPDEKYLVAGNEGYLPTFYLFNVTTGKEIFLERRNSLLGFTIESFAFSPDGKYLAIGGKNNAVHIWEAATGKITSYMKHNRRYMKHIKRIKSIAFSPDGKYLATGSNDKTLLVWEVATGKVKFRMEHRDSVKQVAFSPDGNILVTSSDTVRIWNMFTGNEINHLPIDHTNYTTFSTDGKCYFAFSPDGKYLATENDSVVVFGSDNYLTRIWELATFREIYRMIHKHTLSSIAFSPDGKYLATVSGNTGRVWEINTSLENPISFFYTKDSWLKNKGAKDFVAFSRDGKYLATGSQTIRVWEVATGKVIFRTEHRGSAKNVAFSPDGKYLATGSNDKTSLVWEVATGKVKFRMEHRGSVKNVAFSPDGKYLATGSDDQTSMVWEVATGKVKFRMEHKDSVEKVAFSPDGKYLATVSGNSAYVWEKTTGKKIISMKHKKRSYENYIVFSPDGKYLATGTGDSKDIARIWEVATGKEIFSMKIAYPEGKHISSTYSSIVFSRYGRYLAAHDSKSICVWSMTNGEKLLSKTHDDLVTSLTFSPDGRYLASGVLGYGVIIYDVSTGQEISRIEQNVGSIAFSPNGKYLATGSFDNIMFLMFWRPEDLINEACPRLIHNLTKEEWHKYMGDIPYRGTCDNLP